MRSLYQQGKELVPSLEEVRALPAKMAALPKMTYGSASKTLSMVPVLLRDQKEKFDAMPRSVLLKKYGLPAAGVSSLLACGWMLHVMGHGAFLILMLQGWLTRAKALGVEAWDLVYKSPGVGAAFLKAVISSLAFSLTHPAKALSQLSAALAAAVASAQVAVADGAILGKVMATRIAMSGRTIASTCASRFLSLLLQLQDLAMTIQVRACVYVGFSRAVCPIHRQGESD